MTSSSQSPCKKFTIYLSGFFMSSGLEGVDVASLEGGVAAEG